MTPAGGGGPRRARTGAKRAASRPKRTASKSKPRPAASGRGKAKRAASKPKRRPAASDRGKAKRAASKPKRRPAASDRGKAKRAVSKPKRSPARALAARRSRTALRLVRRPAPPPPAFPQAQGGSAKQRVLFELVRARTSLLAAIHGLTAGSAMRPLAPGRWSAYEVILHLVVRDRVRLRDMEAALRGRRPAWIGLDAATMARVNEEDLIPLRHHGWDDALRLLQTTRQQLMEAIEAVPETPAEAWTAAHPFGELILMLPAHDRHHAGRIQAVRLAPGP